MSGPGPGVDPARPGGGPAVVAIGGGHGLAASLGAARRYAGSITGIVSVADDGGSSGRLRSQIPELPAPGDVRRCLGALADASSLLGRTLEHRFAGEDGLDGHALGNLLLAALTAELGSFEEAVDEVARLVGAVGRVVPATTGPVLLEGTLDAAAGGHRVVGQVAVQNSSGIRGVAIHPPDPASPPEVGKAIEAADQVVIGPGSLFTSVLATAVVPAVRDALDRTAALRVFVANLPSREPEGAGLDLDDHLDALAAHGVPVDVVVCPAGSAACRPRSGLTVLERPVAAASARSHDPELLGRALAALGGPR